MATFLQLSTRVSSVLEETFTRNRIADEERAKEFQAIVKIQAWYRGVRLRCYLKHLHRCANLAQRVWRGFLGRRYYRDLLDQHVRKMRMEFYYAMATLIQKMWKGFYTRKYIHNYYARKRYLQGLVIKNEIVRNELEEYKNIKVKERQQIEEEEANRLLLENARRNHHLISTEVVPGIYNSPFKPWPDQMELVLNSVRPRTPPGPKPRRDNRSGVIIPLGPSLPHTITPQSHSTPLPPIKEKPQGPFRSPAEVQWQRYRPLEPTLRVQTSFTSVEQAREAMRAQEWTMRLDHSTFVPFSHRSVPYQPLLHTTSQFGHIPYGNKYFRETRREAFISQDSFRPLVSPVPVFEKLNKTYSKGTETVP